MAFADAQSGGKMRHGATQVKTVTLAGTVAKGDLLGYSSGWKRALATTGTAIQGMCVAKEAGVSGDVIPVVFGSCIVEGRYSGGTIGAAVYSAEGTDNGKLTETAPTDSGDCNTIMGYVLAADTVLLIPNAYAKTTA